jgi:murein DD-endopeptidase MepM/ murein hydrolase activator NlpD
MRFHIASFVALIAGTAIAAADPTISVTPAKIHPGDPVLVTVTNTDTAPDGKAGGQKLVFFPAKTGYQAVFSVPLGIDEDHVLVEVSGGAKPVSLPVANKKFAETKLVVEDDYANPPKADRDIIDADNRAIGAAYAAATGTPQFTRAFRRPPGKITSPFGEWRTFNDGHRAQHLGADVTAQEGAKVAAINDGTVTLVRDTFLAGNVVVIAHGGGISSMYFHLSKTAVAEGDAVKQGQEIGRAGHTGRTTGPHLHLGIHVANGLVDPIAFLALPLAPASPIAVR